MAALSSSAHHGDESGKRARRMCSSSPPADGEQVALTASAKITASDGAADDELRIFSGAVSGDGGLVVIVAFGA